MNPIGAKELILDCSNGVTMKLVQIPAGKFLMGSPETQKYCGKDEVQHEVTISKPFYMSVYQVTVGQYSPFVKETGQKHHEPKFTQTGDHPVINVSWDDAQAFCRCLSKKTGTTVRLPTEAEWEYACRAGTKTRFSFGDKDADLCKYGNHGDKPSMKGASRQDKEHGHRLGKTAPVGSLKPNDWGLYDMHGNAWEWCQDWYGQDYGGQSSVSDPSGPTSGEYRVLRGGSWATYANSCRSATRSWGRPSLRGYDFGFRVVSVQ